MIFNNKIFDASLPIKTFIANHPVNFMFFSKIFAICFFASLINFFEYEEASSSGNSMNLSQFGNCVWYVVVTMGTIGYGDFVCKTLMA